MNARRLFIASCISLATTSMVFTIRGDILDAMRGDFKITNEQMGAILGPAFWGFTLSIILGGALVDFLGMRRLHILSSLGYIIGVLLVIFAPKPTAKVDSIFSNSGTLCLYAGMLIMGLSQGLVEGVINPLIATIFPDNKVHKLNVLHAWWPGGLIIGGLVAIAMSKMGAGWPLKLGVIILPAIVYLVMILGQEYPKTERVSSGVSNATMFKESFRPLFIVLFLCMWLTASTELGPDQWVGSVMASKVGMTGTWILIYTAGLMFVLRFFAGPIAHKLSPTGLMVGCSILSAIGLFWMSKVENAAMAFVAATIFGVGKTYFWPTMLGITSERFPKGGALLMAIMGGAGMLSISFILPIMGKWYDQQGPGAAFRNVAFLPVALTVVFAAMYLYDKARGGYKIEKLESAPAAGAAPTPAK